MSLAPPASTRLAPATGAPRAAHTVVDLFSGAGGMSCGFARHPAFAIVGAADAQVGKPSSRAGALGCNASYARNIGVAPLAVDLATIAPEELRDRLALAGPPVVLSACAPCTGFSRTLARNHVVDDARNSLVGRIGAFARVLRPEVVVMENARELLMGRFAAHFAALRAALEAMGYHVSAEIRVLSDVGLAQRRERALVVAVRDGPARGLHDLWAGLGVRAQATHVRRAIGHLPAVPAGVAHPSDPLHVAPRNLSPVNRSRLAAIPHDGGSWVDLVGHSEAAGLLAPSMQRRAALGDLGSHPDVYGRMWWDRPAPDDQARVRPHRQRPLRTPRAGPALHGPRDGAPAGLPERLRARGTQPRQPLPPRRRRGAAARRLPGRRARELDPRR